MEESAIIEPQEATTVEEIKEQESEDTLDDGNFVLTDMMTTMSNNNAKMTSTSTSSVSRARLEASLMETLLESQVRSEVESCMESMLVDVEMTYHLRQELQLSTFSTQIDQLVQQNKATIVDAQAARWERDEQRVQLADAMVQDLMSMSRELETLLQWKQQHQHKVESYDQVVAKLVQTEEELEAALRVSYGQQSFEKQHSTGPHPPPPRTTELPATTTTGDAADAAGVQETPSKENDVLGSAVEDFSEIKEALASTTTSTEMKPASTIVDLPPAATPESQPATVVDIPDKEEVAAQPTAEEPEIPYADSGAGETEDEDKKPAAVVSLDEDVEAKEDQVPNLVDIDLEILMHIFGFMDAIDILNTAQINVDMYTRVDTIFGISEDGQSPPQPSSSQKGTSPSIATTTTTAPTTATTASKGPSPPSASSAPSKPAPTTRTTAGAASVPDPFESGVGKGLFSMLQPRPVASGPASSGSTSSTRSTTGRGGAPILTASVTKSILSKLSDSELAAIFKITDKLGKMEKEIILLRNEKEALTDKLEGTEGVKQFLIAKVRDIETKLTQTREEEVKVVQQIASDQEVIAFLDSRVQELERCTETLTKEGSKAQTELQSLKVSSSKKITMLSDMLKYEREKLKDEESEWKATKKVLVKEVKSCRAQIVALQAERDGLKEQNEMLKRAITSSSHSGGGGKRSPVRTRG